MLEGFERRLKTFSFRRRLPSRFGKFRLYANAAARRRYVAPFSLHKESMLYRFAELYVTEGSNVLDIGSNVGAFTAAAAVRAGSQGMVVAVEPDLMVAELLRRSAEATTREDIARIEVLPIALAAGHGFAELAIANRGRVANHLDSVSGSTQTGGTLMKRIVAVSTVDGLAESLETKWDVVKIDVEGAELEVLRGAIDVLRTGPVILCEVRPELVASVTELLNNSGYQLHDADADLEGSRPVGSAAYNTLAVPISRK